MIPKEDADMTALQWEEEILNIIIALANSTGSIKETEPTTSELW
ncbi:MULTISPECIES: hypothetical protein [unclassified Chryseobacterium]|nr:MULTISPECIES: hypothetical protein [unclassified Chryseobacterium]